MTRSHDDILTKPVGMDSKPQCHFCYSEAKYLAPQRKSSQKVWVPICSKHARGWWAGVPWREVVFLLEPAEITEDSDEAVYVKQK